MKQFYVWKNVSIYFLKGLLLLKNNNFYEIEIHNVSFQQVLRINSENEYFAVIRMIRNARKKIFCKCWGSTKNSSWADLIFRLHQWYFKSHIHGRIEYGCVFHAEWTEIIVRVEISFSKKKEEVLFIRY